MNRRIKVLYLIPRCTKSGPIQVLENIVKHMDERKYDLYLISIEPENPQRTILESFSKRFKYQYIEVNKTKALLGLTNDLKRAIEKINPDVIHSTGIIPDMIISRLFPEKQILIVHANLWIDYQYLCGKIPGYLLALWHIGIIKKSRKAIACSKSLADIYNKQGIHIDYIRNGVKSVTTISKSLNREDLNLPVGMVLFLYAASFNERKNHRFLLEVFSEIEQKIDNVGLILLGDGPTFEDLYEEYNNTSNIRFVGRVSNVVDYIHNCDFFVSSSIQEGMPMGVLEAMSEGMPVLLSDIPQHKEIFEINDKIGFLFKLNNKKDFIEKLERILQIDKELASLECVKTIKESFDEEKMSIQYQNMYDEIFGGRQGR